MDMFNLKDIQEYTPTETIEWQKDSKDIEICILKKHEEENTKEYEDLVKSWEKKEK